MGPGVENVVVAVACPGRIGSSGVSPQANEVIGELVSVELETRVICSPARGCSGNQVNEALGGAAGAGASTVIGTTALVPTLPAWSLCCACSVYAPGDRPASVADQAPAETAVSIDSTGAAVSIGAGEHADEHVPVVARLRAGGAADRDRARQVGGAGRGEEIAGVGALVSTVKRDRRADDRGFDFVEPSSRFLFGHGRVLALRRAALPGAACQLLQMSDPGSRTCSAGCPSGSVPA